MAVDTFRMHDKHKEPKMADILSFADHKAKIVKTDEKESEQQVIPYADKDVFMLDMESAFSLIYMANMEHPLDRFYRDAVMRIHKVKKHESIGARVLLEDDTNGRMCWKIDLPGGPITYTTETMTMLLLLDILSKIKKEDPPINVA